MCWLLDNKVVAKCLKKRCVVRKGVSGFEFHCQQTKLFLYYSKCFPLWSLLFVTWFFFLPWANVIQLEALLIKAYIIIFWTNRKKPMSFSFSFCQSSLENAVDGSLGEPFSFSSHVLENSEWCCRYLFVTPRFFIFIFTFKVVCILNGLFTNIITWKILFVTLCEAASRLRTERAGDWAGPGSEGALPNGFFPVLGNF